MRGIEIYETRVEKEHDIERDKTEKLRRERRRREIYKQTHTREREEEREELTAVGRER